MKPDFYFVFDIESVGLHGPGFAFGFVVLDCNGAEVESGYGALKPNLDGVVADDVQFLQENVFPALWGWTHLSQAGDDWKVRNELWIKFRSVFWDKWVEWKEKGAVLVSDCAWPVEARFLAACVDDDRATRAWQGPYPLLDVSSVLLAAGKDPVGTFGRKAGEFPAHNLLADARQSGRVLIETLSGIGKRFTE